MLSYVFTYPTLTRCQQAQSLLRSRGIHSRIIRQSRQLSAQGCSQGIFLDGSSYEAALSGLRAADRPPVRIFTVDGHGQYSRVWR